MEAGRQIDISNMGSDIAVLFPVPPSEGKLLGLEFLSFFPPHLYCIICNPFKVYVMLTFWRLKLYV